MNVKYLPRIADKALELALKTSGAVLIAGPKWCGKTRTAEEMSKSVLYMQDPDHSAEYKLMNDFNTFGFLFESLCVRDVRIYADSHEL